MLAQREHPPAVFLSLPNPLINRPVCRFFYTGNRAMCSGHINKVEGVSRRARGLPWWKSFSASPLLFSLSLSSHSEKCDPQ